LSPDGKYIASVEKGIKFIFYETVSYQISFEKAVPGLNAYALDFTPDTKKFLYN